MTLGEQFQLATLLVACVSGIGIPIAIWRMKQQDDSRDSMKAEIHDRLNHLDACFEEVKRRVLGEVASRSELLIFRTEVNEIINRQRIAISNETHGLHERIFRLEERIMK